MMPLQRGFTLIELAIVMLVLTILAAGILLPLTSQIETRRLQQANQNLATIQDALTGYAMSHPVSFTCTCNYAGNQLDITNSTCNLNAIPASQICDQSNFSSPQTIRPATRHYLPCPNYDGTGIEAQRDATGQCINPAPSSVQTPLLPWATLGLSPTDPWGDSYGYDVYADYANNLIGFGSNNPPDPSSTPAPGTCPNPASSAYIHIYQSCTSSSGLPNSLIAGQLAAVVMSFGSNGWGAYNPANHAPTSGTTYTTNALPSNPDEEVNSRTGNLSHNYVSHPATKAGSTPGQFDDILVGVPYAVLLNRVCPAGGCP